MLHDKRRFEEQRSVIGAAAEACPDVLPNINNYAWALATLPDASLRDGAKAIRLIRNAIANLGNRDPAFLDTLAAGLAEVGRFDEAMSCSTARTGSFFVEVMGLLSSIMDRGKYSRLPGKFQILMLTLP